MEIGHQLDLTLFGHDTVFGRFNDHVKLVVTDAGEPHLVAATAAAYQDDRLAVPPGQR